MSTQSTHTGTDTVLPARRRIVALSERKAALPVAIIAHEGAQRDELEAQISRVRPVVTFPSLAHLGADAAGGARWAGILVARSHAWDARLDTCVPRRAFIALYGLTDEGYGWPETVKRVGSAEELETWLGAISAPILPPEDRMRDRPRITKPRSKPSIFTMSLAGDPVPVREEPKLPVVTATPATVQLTLPALLAPTADAAPTARKSSPPKAVKTKPAKAAKAAPKAQPSVPAKQRSPAEPKRAAPKAARNSEKRGLRLTSSDAQEQAVIDAVGLVGAATARAILDAMERFDRT